MYIRSFYVIKKTTILSSYMHVHGACTHASISPINTFMHTILVFTYCIYDLLVYNDLFFIRGSGFRGRDREAEDAGLLYELSQFCGHLEERRAKHAAVLHTGSDGRGAGTSTSRWTLK